MHSLLLQAETTTNAFNSLTDYGLAGIVILALGYLAHLFIKNQMRSTEQLQQFVMNELKEMNTKMVTVIQNNTNALEEIKAEQRELRDTLNALQQEIKQISK